MPSRMIRESLLNSDRFLGLPDNTSRICYIACLLHADDRGNVEASPGALVRMWRDFGVDSVAKAEGIAHFLTDHDLIRMYESGDKQFIHVPRFGQRMRSFKRACPPSPWCEKVEESNNSPEICPQVAAIVRKSRPEVKRSEEKGRTSSASNAKIAFSAEAGWENISPRQRDVWERAYPALSLDAEFAAAAAWLMANPENRKSNYARFLNGWLQRAQDRAPRKGHAGGAATVKCDL
jgi:hypothetical protein